MKFYLDPRSGVSPYLQIVHQVKHSLRLGLLQMGDQLPKVREVVADLAINPNTVLKAYHELELEGLIGGRPGQGTFVIGTLPSIAPSELATLRGSLEHWIQSASAAGLDVESIQALFASTIQRLGEEITA